MGNQNTKFIKKKLKDQAEVLPFNELNNIDIGFEKLIDKEKKLCEEEEQKYSQNKNLETEKKFVNISKKEIVKDENQSEQKDSDYLLKCYEKHLSEQEIKYLKRQFLNYSSDGIISNRQFWTFLDLQNIYNTTFAKAFYKAICNFKENMKLDHLRFMDYTKFIQFVTIFTKKGKLDNGEVLENLRLKMIYSVFDSDGNDELDRLEFRNLLTSFVEALLLCKFESKAVQEKVDILQAECKNTSLIEKTLDQYVDEIFSTSSLNQDSLTYDDWEKWMKKITGMDCVLNFSGYLKNN